MPPAGFIITAWAHDGRLVVGRCAVPKVGDSMVSGWVIRDTAKAFGDAFRCEGPSAPYGGSCADKPAGEEYPGAWAVGTLRGLPVPSFGPERIPAVPDPKAAVEAVLNGPETPLEMESALGTLRLCQNIMDAARRGFPREA